MNISCLQTGQGYRFVYLGANYMQKEYYHGKDKIHYVAFQVTTGIDGIIMDMYGGFPGSRHHSHIYTSSLLNRRFAEIQQINNIQYKTYADKGYYNDTHTVAAYHININTPIEHRNANNIMTRQRIGVEWGIEKIYVICPLIKHLEFMKTQLSPISSYIYSSALLCNIHTCLNKLINFYISSSFASSSISRSTANRAY